MTLRIAVLGPSRNALREPYAGGQESFTAHFCLALRRRGHHVRLYAVAGSDPRLADELREFPALPRLSAVAALDAQLPERDFLKDHHAYAAATADVLARHDVDVVSNQSLHQLPLTTSPALEQAHGIPVVTTLHTPPFPWLELGIALAAPTARYVAVSSAAARPFTTIDPGRLSVIPNGIDLRRWPEGPGGDDAVWVGRITPEKGPHLAVAACRRAEIRLRLIGPIADQQYFDRVLAPLLGSGIEYDGAATQGEIARIVGGSSVCLVTPLWEEPYGLVAAESMACGTPVLALARGALPEVVGAAAAAPGGVVVRGESHDVMVAELARGIRAAARLPRSQARRRAETSCDLERTVTAYEQLFATVLERPAR